MIENANLKPDGRKNNGGQRPGKPGRKSTYENETPIMVSFKVNLSTKEALNTITGYGKYIESLIRKDLGLIR